MAAPSSRRPPIGIGFGRLWSASTVGNLGDGVGRVAIALLAAQLTRDPLAVAIVTALTYLPWLLIGLPAGVLADRHDRRRLAFVAALIRAGVITLLTVAAATGSASLWLLYLVVLMLYTCETFYDTSVIAIVPMVVRDRDRLDVANGRVQGGQLIAESFIGPPLASSVFALAAAYAFGINVACYLIAAVLLVTLPGSYQAKPPAETPPTSMGREMTDGLRFVWRHPLHRLLLVLMMATFFGVAMVNAITVLWTLDVLGVSEAWYGAFVLTLAVGALIGSQTAAPLARRFGRGRGMWLTLVVAGVAGLVAAATTLPYVAAIAMAMMGWAGLTFNVINVSMRQRLTPASMLGRVTGIYRGATTGVMVVGSIAGGIAASLGGLRMPFVVFGLATLVIALFVTRRLTNEVVDEAIAVSDAQAHSDESQ